jgi:translation elongation factor EF-Tu-like GTPase
MVMPGDNVKITGELITPIPWRRSFGSPSVKAGAPSAPAW